MTTVTASAKKYSAGICLALLLFPLFAVPLAANSAQAHWQGTTATGAIVSDETCPLTVESERLTFDLPEFPQLHYSDISDYLAYSGRVTAAYTFSNPADYTVNATLVFPFGAVPDYDHLYDADTEEPILSADTEKYQITSDNSPVEKTLRHTFSPRGAAFEWEKDLALLQEDDWADAFYSPDLSVTRYTYVPGNVDLETYDAATAAFLLCSDPSRTKVLMENQAGAKLLTDGMELNCWVEGDDPITVTVIGEPLNEMPDWHFYENGACEKEIDGAMTLIRTETLSFRDLALSRYPQGSDVLERDWYHAVVASLHYYEWSHGAISGTDFCFDVTDQLMRWYEYELTLKPGEKIVNTVTAPFYPSIHRNYEPPIYEYTYLLSPAQSWKSFGTLDIAVNTPYYMTKDSTDAFERTGEGYFCHLTELPEGELTFTLCSSETPLTPAHNSGYLQGLPVFLTVLLILLLLAAAAVLIRRKKPTA